MSMLVGGVPKSTRSMLEGGVPKSTRSMLVGGVLQTMEKVPFLRSIKVSVLEWSKTEICWI